MNYLRHPDLVQKLAAEYALGTLKGGARRRFEQLARRHREVRMAVQRWQDRLASLTVLQPGVMPDAALWQRVRNLVEADIAAQRQRASAAQPAPRDARSARGGGWSALTLWRGGALAAAALSVLLVMVNLRLARQIESQTAEPYVAVLSDDKAVASMLVTFDPKTRALTLQRIGGFAERDDQSLQLWALPEGRGPQSLGVLPRERIVKLTAAADVQGVPLLAVSLEPKGGSPNPHAPSGPVIFKGQVIRRML
jgi:anti-sigma-K factor RskA